jgi:hypothetical protein
MSAAPDEQLQALREENARLWSENNRLRAERREIEHYERLLAQMEGTLSWRLTVPLRAAKTLYVKVRRRLDDTRHG